MKTMCDLQQYTISFYIPIKKGYQIETYSQICTQEGSVSKIVVKEQNRII